MANEVVDAPPPTHRKGKSPRFTKHMEIDARPLFASPSGLFFHEKLVQARLNPRFGDNDWFVTKKKFETFRRGLRIDNNILKVRLAHSRMDITREFIAEWTGLDLNPHFSQNTMNLYCDARIVTIEAHPTMRTKTQLTQDIAPYMIDDEHLDKHNNVFKASALQENQLLVAKWFTANFLGLESRHLINGKCAWFLKHLTDGDLLDLGWCPCEALRLSFIHLESRPKDGYNLPCLASHLFNVVKGITDRASEFPFKPPTKKFDFLRSDIPGFWTADSPVLGEHAPRYLGKDMSRWIQWRATFGAENVGGGYAYKRGSLDVAAPPPVVVQEHGAVQEDPEVQGVHVDGDGEPVQDDTAQGAATAQTFARRRRRQDRTPASYIPGYCFDARIGPFPPFTTPAEMPQAAYFDPNYVHMIPQDQFPAVQFQMSALQNQFWDFYQYQQASGFRPVFPYPQPPSYVTGDASSSGAGLGGNDGGLGGDAQGDDDDDHMEH